MTRRSPRFPKDKPRSPATKADRHPDADLFQRTMAGVEPLKKKGAGKKTVGKKVGARKPVAKKRKTGKPAKRKATPRKKRK